MINVCLVGSGNMAAIRLKSLEKLHNIELKSIVSVSGGVNLKLKKNVKIFKKFEDISEKEFIEINAFIITSTTSKHIDDIKEIIKGSKSSKTFIFIEKPIAATATEIENLFKTCPSNVQICCGFQRRFDNSYVKLKNAIHNGSIGTPTFCRVFFGDHPVPKVEFLLKDGCPFMDLTPHDVDFVRWCLQDEVESVSATGSSTIPVLKENNVLDQIVVTLKFKKGCIVNLFCSRSCSYGYDQRCEFYSAKGRVEVENIPEDGFKIYNSNGQTTSTLSYSYPQRFEQAFDSELTKFFEVCLGKSEWPITTNDCIQVQKIATAAAQACKTQKTVKL